MIPTFDVLKLTLRSSSMGIINALSKYLLSIIYGHQICIAGVSNVIGAPTDRFTPGYRGKCKIQILGRLYGGTNRNPCTSRLIVLRADLLMHPRRTPKKLGQSDLLHGSKSSAEINVFVNRHLYRASICEGGLGSRNSVCPSVRLSVCHTRGL